MENVIMTEKLESKSCFEVFVDDNFHYQDESERYKYGEYETYEAAVEACKQIVDGELLHVYQSSMSAADLYYSYTSFGEDPFIRPSQPKERFSAWNYARQRCDEICASGSIARAKNAPEGEDA
jgi:hypothetical protein